MISVNDYFPQGYVLSRIARRIPHGTNGPCRRVSENSWVQDERGKNALTLVECFLDNLQRTRLQLELAEGLSNYVGKWSALTIHDYMIPGSGDGITVSLQ